VQVSSAQLPTLARLAAGIPVPAAPAASESSSNGAAPAADSQAAADLVMDDFRCFELRIIDDKHHIQLYPLGSGAKRPAALLHVE